MTPLKSAEYDLSKSRKSIPKYIIILLSSAIRTRRTKDGTFIVFNPKLEKWLNANDIDKSGKVTNLGNVFLVRFRTEDVKKFEIWV